MAKLKTNLLGMMSGKLGDLIFYIVNGKTQAVKTYTKPFNPQTLPQQANRNKFAVLSKELGPLLNAIKKGHPSMGNAYRKVFGKACTEAIAGEYPKQYLDYSKVRLAEGKIKPAPKVEMVFCSKTHTIHIYWENPKLAHSKWCRNSDIVYVVCFDSSKEDRLRTYCCGKRSDCKASVEFPDSWNAATTHIWLYLGAENHSENSDSMYLAHPV